MELMDFELIDYSAAYFTEIKKVEIPRKRTGKFVQIFNEAADKEYLVLSPKELSIYHANIVERFFTIRKLKGAYNSRKDYFTIQEDDWNIAGGGFWVIDEDKKTLELSGTSKAYGPFEADGLKRRILKSGKLPGFSVFVNGA